MHVPAWITTARPSTPRRDRPRRRGVVPSCERLEGLTLLSTVGPVVSGTVFVDKNLDGRFEPGEATVAGAKLQLVNAAGVVVGTAATDAHGVYSFATDSTAAATPHSVTQTLRVPLALTNIDAAPLGPSLAPFDPSLGTLVDVKVDVEVDVTSWVHAENTSTSLPSDIAGSVASTYQIDGLGPELSGGASAETGVFHAATFDGTLDYGGTSGVSFDPLTAVATRSVTLTAPGALASFTGGSGPLNPTASIAATAHVLATSGNTDYDVTTKGTAVVTVTYDYVPSAGLKPGKYTVVRLPAGPGAMALGGAHSVAVTLTPAGSAHNDFALSPTAPSLPRPPAPGGTVHWPTRFRFGTTFPTTTPTWHPFGSITAFRSGWHR